MQAPCPMGGGTARAMRKSRRWMVVCMRRCLINYVPVRKWTYTNSREHLSHSYWCSKTSMWFLVDLSRFLFRKPMIGFLDVESSFSQMQQSITDRRQVGCTLIDVVASNPGVSSAAIAGTLYIFRERAVTHNSSHPPNGRMEYEQGCKVGRLQRWQGSTRTWRLLAESLQPSKGRDP